MSKQAIDEIKEVEAEAEKIRLDAELRAKAMLADAKEQAERLKSTSREQAERALAAELTAMRKKAEELTEKNRLSAQSEAAEILETARDNLPEAVKLIVSEIARL